MVTSVNVVILRMYLPGEPWVRLSVVAGPDTRSYSWTSGGCAASSPSGETLRLRLPMLLGGPGGGGPETEASAFRGDKKRLIIRLLPCRGPARKRAVNRYVLQD
jgi:hypothetical protein